MGFQLLLQQSERRFEFGVGGKIPGHWGTPRAVGAANRFAKITWGRAPRGVRALDPAGISRFSPGDLPDRRPWLAFIGPSAAFLPGSYPRPPAGPRAGRRRSRGAGVSQFRA